MVSTILAGVEHDRAQRDSRVVLAIFVDNEAGVLNKVSGLLSARGFNIESLTVSPTNLESLSRMTVVIRDATEEKAAQAIKQLNDVVNVWAVVDYTGTNSLHVRARRKRGPRRGAPLARARPRTLTAATRLPHPSTHPPTHFLSLARPAQRELVMVKVSYMPQTGNAGADSSPHARLGYDELIAAQAHKASVRDLGALFGAEVVDVGSRHITYQLTSWSRRIDAFIRMLEPWGIIEVARSGMVAMLRSPVSGTPQSALKRQAATVVDAASLPPG
jgi:acetolactate synthase-1/3 small subunit